uniref:Uncharacterized protein n=1 Tax=Anguilla anguilla TaxID=7936 RepID=A0A0E9Y0G4_ANGAN
MFHVIRSNMLSPSNCSFKIICTFTWFGTITIKHLFTSKTS